MRAAFADAAALMKRPSSVSDSIFSERFRNDESAGVSARLEPSNPRGRTESVETATGPNS